MKRSIIHPVPTCACHACVGGRSVIKWLAAASQRACLKTPPYSVPIRDVTRPFSTAAAPIHQSNCDTGYSNTIGPRGRALREPRPTERASEHNVVFVCLQISRPETSRSAVSACAARARGELCAGTRIRAGLTCRPQLAWIYLACGACCSRFSSSDAARKV